jgi:hypothetical protein
MANILSRLFGAPQHTGWIEPPALAAALDAADPPIIVDVRAPPNSPARSAISMAQ